MWEGMGKSEGGPHVREGGMLRNVATQELPRIGREISLGPIGVTSTERELHVTHPKDMGVFAESRYRRGPSNESLAAILLHAASSGDPRKVSPASMATFISSSSGQEWRGKRVAS